MKRASNNWEYEPGGIIPGNTPELSKEESSWFGQEKPKLIPIKNLKNSNRRKFIKNKRLYYLFFRDMGICQLCKNPVRLKDVSIDHIVAKNNGGVNDLFNLQISHEFCNNIKGDIYHSLSPDYFLNHPKYKTSTK